MRDIGCFKRKCRHTAGSFRSAALFITRGYRDALRIAYQNRPRIFDREIVLPELLYSKAFEVEERIGAHGDVLIRLNEAHVLADLKAIYNKGIRSIASVLMHSYRFTQHEAVLLGEFCIRAGSDGMGRWSGGHRTVRRVKFLEKMTASIRSNKRLHAPRGVDGGNDGLPGMNRVEQNRVERIGSEVETLNASNSREIEPGDVFVIETPGAGGYGEAP